MKTQSLFGLSTLLVLIVYASLRFNIVVATKVCESEDGRSSQECDDDEDCCESDEGEAECCTDLGVAGIVVMVIIFIGFILCSFCICYFCWRIGGCQNNSMNNCQCDQFDDNSHTVRSIPVLVRRAGISSEQSSAGVVYRTGRVIIQEPSSSRNVTWVRADIVNYPSSSLDHNANTNALSANNDCSNTLNDDAPPPYFSTDKPPSYAEIDL